MQVRADQLEQHLARGLRPVYTLHGDEALLVQEAADALRAAARTAGHTERQVHTVSGAHYNWSGLLGASRSMSLFAERQLIEIRIPNGKPGKDGSDALQRYCDSIGDGGETLTLVLLPRLDRMQLSSAWFTALDGAGVTVRLDPIERAALPAWIARRLARQGQRVPAGEQGEHCLAWIADRVEGNLLAAHQELQKLALLQPAGELSLEAVRAAVQDVARFEPVQLCEAAFTGRADRVLRVLEGLRAEGESPARIAWVLGEDLRILHRVRAAVSSGTPMAVALRGERLWGARERWIERSAQQARLEDTAGWLAGARCCDAIAKGLRMPGWPADGWAALARLAWEVTRRCGSAGPGPRAASGPHATVT
jgi:DNA polymerase III subunit delta